MAKLVEYDVTDVEDSGGGGSEVPKPGVYPAVIKVCERRSEKKDGTPIDDLRIALDLGGDFMWLWTYIGLGEASDWRLKQLISALDLKMKGKFDPDKLVGKMLRVKVNPDTWNDEPTARAGRLMKALKGDKLAEASATPEADAEEPAEPEEVVEESDATPAEDGDFTPTREDPDDNEVGSYDDWADDDLEGEASDRNLTLPGGRGSKRDKCIKALRADDAENAGDDTGDEPAAGGDDAPADEYDQFEDDELEKEVTDRELTVRKPRGGANAKQRYREAMIAALRKDDDDNPFNPEASD